MVSTGVSSPGVPAPRLSVFRLEGLGRPWSVARQARRERCDVVIAPLQAGAAALVRGVPIVSTLAPAGPRERWLERWLRRRQSRRSWLFIAPDRRTAVDCALRWRLDLARIRIVAGDERDLEVVLRRELSRGPAAKWWYA